MQNGCLFWTYGPLKLKIVDSMIWLCPICSLKNILDIFIQISNFNRWHAEWLPILELWPVGTENIRFCDLIVSAL